MEVFGGESSESALLRVANAFDKNFSDLHTDSASEAV
jgi:hypothetical protein